MSKTDSDADRIRRAALDRVDRSARNAKLAFLGAAGVEVLFLAAFLLLADFSNRTHVLLLLATMTVYSIVGLGLVVLGAHVSRNTRLILRALETRDGANG